MADWFWPAAVNRGGRARGQPQALLLRPPALAHTTSSLMFQALSQFNKRGLDYDD